jgi:hypothetical protein
MPDRIDISEDKKPDVVPLARAAWVRPTLTRLAAADAELGTRPTGPDGPFSVS